MPKTGQKISFDICAMNAIVNGMVLQIQRDIHHFK